jgi:hypothetical protein
MYNAYAMSATLEAKKNSQQASMITAGFAGLMILIMFLLKWEMPAFEKNIESPGIEVELNLPEEPEIPAKGGGGGGNPVHASGPAGVASYSPPQPGVKDDSKDIEEDNDKTSPAITKPDIVKPTATKINNTSVVKTTPKPVIETPAPRIPKAVAGKTLTGAGKGGGTDDYERSGGSGNGNGVGNGNGTGGGSGNGNGGGNGTGNGGGNGPKVTNGDRKIVRSYSFEGDLDKATIYANVNVSPDGTGKFINIAKGSSSSSNSYKEAIMRYLQNIRFDKSDHESMVTVRFNFTVN